MSSVSAPPPSEKQKRAGVLWDFFISIYKALCDRQPGGNRGKRTFIVATQVSVTAKRRWFSSAALGAITCPASFGWYRPARPQAVQSPAWLLAWVRFCVASASVGPCCSWHGSRDLSNSVSPTSPPSLLALCPAAPPFALTLEHSSD